MVSDWLLERDLLLFSISLLDVRLIFSLLILSGRLLFASDLSDERSDEIRIRRKETQNRINTNKRPSGRLIRFSLLFLLIVYFQILITLLLMHFYPKNFLFFYMKSCLKKYKTPPSLNQIQNGFRSSRHASYKVHSIRAQWNVCSALDIA